MITKTLTFGLGTLFGFDKRNDQLIVLEEEQRKKTYTAILKGFGDFARLCNYTTSALYVSKILGVPLEGIGVNTGYKLIEEKFNIQSPLNGSVKNQAFGLAKSHFTGDNYKRLMRRGECVLPTHKADGTHPLYFHTNAVDLHKNNEEYYIVYHVLASGWAKEQDLLPWIAFRIKIKPRDKTGIDQIDKILSGEWKKGSGQLVKNTRKKGPKYLMHLVVSYEPSPYKTLSENTVMGIDRGVNNPTTIHFRTDGQPMGWAMIVGNGRLMLSARGVIRREIIRLLRGLKKKDSPIHGPAREAASKRLKELRKQERRVMKTASQTIAAQIADQAKRHGAGIWQLEKLEKGVKSTAWLDRNWAPGLLLDAIRWQAQQVAAEIREVNPAYTSQLCSSCFHIDKENRPKGKKGAEYFECTRCGHNENADKNAARNLSNLDIEDRINSVLLNKN